MSRTIKNLVFEGGGVKGIAYVGALTALHENGLLKSVERVAGTSVGAITATLVSLKLTSEEILSIVGKTDFKKFQDHWDPIELPFRYGLYKGEYFLNWIRKVIKTSNKSLGLNENSTFEDLRSAGCKDLNVYATDLNTKEAKRFSYETTPTVIVAEAIRASMSIPLFFQAWQFSNNIPDDHMYIDGGTVYNFPINAFDTDDNPNWETLGFHLNNLSNVKPSINMKPDQVLKYVRTLFDTILDSHNIDVYRNPVEKSRSVLIDDFGISATEFNISETDKKRLYISGYRSTCEYLLTKMVHNHN